MGKATTKNQAQTGGYHLATYYRISHDDGKESETLSITNQRNLVTSYISEHSDFSLAKITEYIDDGLSGASTDREAYKRLMSDVERGVIDCIVVKDLSRIGRNLIDVDDLLMNHLVTLGVRFIAINNGYDSLTSPLSNLELAVINLANQHYNRDLAQKSITAKQTKSKQGEFLGGQAPFGYKKCGTKKNKLLPDTEAADYVRLIFSLACEGKGNVEIAKILNAQGVPSPSIYKMQNGRNKPWHNAIDPDYCFWSGGVVYKMLKNETYIGTLVANRLKVSNPSTGTCVSRPKEEWIIVPNAHEPLVSKEVFEKAQLVTVKKRCTEVFEKIFITKIKCPSCEHTMIRYNPKKPRFKCGTVKVTDHYGCKTHNILQSSIESSLLPAVVAHISVLIDHEEMKLAQLQKAKVTVKSLEPKITTEKRGVEALESSITKLFTSLAMGKMDQDMFVQKKGAINETVARKNANIKKWEQDLHRLTMGRQEAEATIAELSHFRSVEKLDKEIVNALVDKIYVHGEDDIEIVWLGTLEVTSA